MYVIMSFNVPANFTDPRVRIISCGPSEGMYHCTGAADRWLQYHVLPYLALWTCCL